MLEKGLIKMETEKKKGKKAKKKWKPTNPVL